MKQVQVAELTGISQGRLSRYENEKKCPDLATLDRLLTCYGADLKGLARALKAARDKEKAKPFGGDPEFTAKVKRALIERARRKCQTFQE